MKKLLILGMIICAFHIANAQDVLLSLNGKIVNRPDTIYWLYTGQSNWENQSVAGDTAYQHDYSLNSKIEVLVGSSWVLANRYSNNIMGGSVVRESAILVAAQKYLLEQPNTVIRIISYGISGKALHYWTPKQTGFGEVDTFNTVKNGIDARIANLTGSQKISAVVFQQGEENQNNGTLNAYLTMLTEVHDYYLSTGKFTQYFKMFLLQPTTTYEGLRAVQDSIDNGTFDYGLRRWIIVKNSFTAGVDATHFKNSQHAFNGQRLASAMLSFYSNQNKDMNIKRGDTSITIATTTGASTIILGLNSVIVNKPLTGSTALFSGEMVSTKQVRGWSSSTTGGQVLASMFSGSVGAYPSFRCTGFVATSFIAELRGVAESTGGGWALAMSTNGTTLTQSMYGDHNGSVSIGTSTPAASAVLDLQGTTKGFLPPRLTSAQVTAIGSPATGLTVYCTDCTATDASTGVMQTYNGSSWKNNW